MMISNLPILSPCIGVCSLDAQGYCEGCHRTSEEITHWISYEEAHRRYIVDQVLPTRVVQNKIAITAQINLTTLVQAIRPLADPPSEPAWNHAELVDLFDPLPRKPAAVLVPLVTRPSGLAVIFTRRTEHLSNHAGQISFPGGRIESTDIDAVAAALREAHEETGILPQEIRPFGYLDCYETISNFCVTPVLGEIASNYRASPDPMEVAEVFEVPLSFFLTAKNKRIRHIYSRNRLREVAEFEYGDYLIWGATAAMLVNLISRLEKSAGISLP